MFILDRYFHILTFSIDKVHLSWGISERILTLDVNLFTSEGYVEFNTNVGLESLEIIDEKTSKSDTVAIKEYLSKVDKLEVKYV